MSKERIYIAGPMRSIPLFNFPAFDKARDELLMESGWDVVSPADLDREVGFDALHLPADTDWNQPPPGLVIADCVRRDLDYLQTCDAIYLLAGWHSSVGASAEYAVAKWLGLDIYDEET